MTAAGLILHHSSRLPQPEPYSVIFAKEDSIIKHLVGGLVISMALKPHRIIQMGIDSISVTDTHKPRASELVFPSIAKS